MSHKRNDGNYIDKDEARTPKPLFKKLNDRWCFNIDLCASELNHLCVDYCTKETPMQDVNFCEDDVGYCNCPYSNPEQFIAKCAEGSLDGATIVMLLPVDTSTLYFHKYIMGIDPKTENPNGYGASEIIYLYPRVKFDNPDGTPMKGSPLTASQVVVFKRDVFDGSPVISSMRWK